MLLRSKRAFGVSIDRNDSSRAWHLELEISVMRYRIESSKCGSSKQCVVAAAEGDDVDLRGCFVLPPRGPPYASPFEESVRCFH